MGQINLFNDKVTKFYLGESDCRIYLGDTLLYPSEEPQPSNVMFKRVHKDGTIFNIECGESGTTLTSAITRTNTTIQEISGTTNQVTAITIGDCVESIGNRALSDWTKVEGDLIIPNSVTSIGDRAFYNCSGFTGNLIIPNSVTSIDGRAFYNCSGFNAIYFKSETPPTLGINVFNSTTCPMYVPCESVDAYKTATNWSNYADKIKGYDFELNAERCDSSRDDDELIDE